MANEKLEKLKAMIDEENYPYFNDDHLEREIATGEELRTIARRLCLTKANIPGIKLGDVEIPSPSDYFLGLADSYRKSATGTVRRYDR